MKTNKGESYSVVVIEDEPTYITRFCDAINNAKGLHLAACFDNAADALEWLKDHEPDVLLCDLGLPDLPGTTVIKYCAERYPNTEIMVISMYEDESHVIRAFEAGASGYLLKDSLSTEIAERIFELIGGGAPMTPVIARLVLKRFRSSVAFKPVVRTRSPLPVLTAKELLILNRIAQGFKYLEIAAQESISVNTVATHVKHIYEKLAVNSRSEAVYEAQQLGLLEVNSRYA